MSSIAPNNPTNEAFAINPRILDVSSGAPFSNNPLHRLFQDRDKMAMPWQSLIESERNAWLNGLERVNANPWDMKQFGGRSKRGLSPTIGGRRA
jgi:hypothetical protein